MQLYQKGTLCLLQGHSDMPQYLWWKQFRKSVCWLTVKHKLSKKGQQSVLFISLSIFTFFIWHKELGRRYKSLMHFVLSVITFSSILSLVPAYKLRVLFKSFWPPVCCPVCCVLNFKLCKSSKFSHQSQRAGKQSCC